MHALCLHGHFYQPPREHPWLGVVEPEASAAPERDWNTRITRECYAPNAAARILDRAGRLRAVLNAYEWTSFDVGPTLLGWLAPHAPAVMEALRRADAASQTRTGHGNAWAQAYGHPILPLSSPRDVRTQVVWGRREFEHRFGRAPEGMWLPEMAVDLTSLEALADAGITLTLLAPHQARRIRPLDAPPTAWQAVTAADLDTRRLYRCLLPGGRSVDVLFRDAALSQDVAFGGLLKDGASLAARLTAALDAAEDGGIATVAVDGETYGHHHRFGEMALAFALERLRALPDVALLGPAAFRAVQPPAYEVEIVERTSWSCPHGVERWRADCGCRVGGPAEWSQAWRAPLRTAIDWLRDELAVVYEHTAGELLRDPWGARDRYVDCLLVPERRETFLAAEATRPLSPAAAMRGRRALELARHALLMQTSCGWFFDELTGLEPVQILRYAARAIELAETLGAEPEAGFVERLAAARSNRSGGGSGADLYRRAARGAAATPARVAATASLMALLGEAPEVPGHEVVLSPGAGATVEVDVVEQATGATARVHVTIETDPQAPPRCRADDTVFSLADGFGVQRERLLARLERDVVAAGRETVAGLAQRLEPLVAGDGVLPLGLATLLGWEAAATVVSALDEGSDTTSSPLTERAAALIARGARLPPGWLGPRLALALEHRLAGLPGSAREALALLDLARSAGEALDLAPAQVALLLWWQAHPAAVAEPAIAALGERLGVAPPDSAS